MSQTIRIATFNVENLDEEKPNIRKPSLEERIKLMQPQLERLNADIIFFQEIHAQKLSDQADDFEFTALKKLLKGTRYENFQIAPKLPEEKHLVNRLRNLVVVSRFEIVETKQYKHDFIEAPVYKKVTAVPAEEAKKITWERPITYSKIKLPNQQVLHCLNLHLKSKNPTNIDGQKVNTYTWKTAYGWAEGYFISSMKRVGQALETRRIVDDIMDSNDNPLILVCGDLNADSGDVPVKAILGEVESTGNGDLADRVMVPCQKTVPESSRYTLWHHGKGEMIDHLMVSRNMLQYYKGTEIHNETLPDESIAFAYDTKYPESDHAPVVAEFIF